MIQSISRINELSEAQAPAEFLKCCGSDEWAKQMSSARPFSNWDELSSKADEIWWNLDEEDWLEAFRAHGVDEVVIIRGYLGDVLGERDLGPGVRFVENRDWEHNNILESLFCAESDIDGPLLMTYSDIIFTPEVVRRLVAAEGDICLIIDRAFRDIYEGRSDHPLPEAEVSDLDKEEKE